MSGVSGNEGSVTKINNITMIFKKVGCSDQKGGISDLCNIKIIGADYTKSNTHSASGACSRQSPTNVKAKQLDEYCDMK